MSPKPVLPKKMHAVRHTARKVIAPITSLSGSVTSGYPSQRTEAGRELPPYFLVYFLLVDLLQFRAFGRHEKVAWSIPIVYKGKVFAIEHRKMGLGIFARNLATDEPEAREILVLIKRAIRVAEPFFEWMAEEAVNRSKVNVLNHGAALFARFAYHLKLYRRASKAAEKRKDVRKITTRKTSYGSTVTSIRVPYFQLKQNAQWLALSCIETFFGWTEHVFIHLALLTGRINTASEVAKLATADWAEKYKTALDMRDKDTQRLYNELIEIRRQLRNMVAHGAFGKQGEAFKFHSAVGAVPVLLPHRATKRNFSLGHGLSFEDDAAIRLIEKFVTHLWAGTRAPARLYIQESGLPIILTFITDGTYARAMKSENSMESFIEYWSGEQDRATDMDW